MAGFIFYSKVNEDLQIDDMLNNGIAANPEIKAIQDKIASEDPEKPKKILTKALIMAFLVFGFTVFLSAVNQTIAEPFLQPYVKNNIIIGSGKIPCQRITPFRVNRCLGRTGSDSDPIS